MIINLPTKRISVISVTFQRVLPTRWRRKLVGIYMERNYVTVALCVLLLSFNGRFLRKQVGQFRKKLRYVELVFTVWISSCSARMNEPAY